MPLQSSNVSQCPFAEVSAVTGRGAGTFDAVINAEWTIAGEFARGAGISEAVTAARLRELVSDGLLEREDYRRPGQRARQRHRLTTKRAELLRALVALMPWSDRWCDEPGGGFD